MTATDGTLLHRAVLAAPEDDTVRLAYADWLDENPGEVECAGCRGTGWHRVAVRHGPGSDDEESYSESRCPRCGGTGRAGGGRAERAEFVRVQCELAKYIDLSLEPAKSLAVREHDLWNFGQPGGHWSIDDPLPFEHCIRCIDFESISTSTSTHDPIAIYRRGFVDQITCTAADWLAHADQIYWHPSQTVPCSHPFCEHGTIGRPRPGHVGGQWMGRMCDRCDGMGNIPRECPPTAHPIVSVRLTTAVEMEELTVTSDFVSWKLPGRPRQVLRGVNQFQLDGRGMLAMLRVEWPHITFELPA